MARIDPKKGKKGPLTLAAAGTSRAASGRVIVAGTSQLGANNLPSVRVNSAIATCS